MTKNKERCLLDEMAHQLHCEYLSQLTSPEIYPLVLDYLKAIEAESYSMKDWNDAVWYLTKEARNFSSPSQAKEYILKK